MGEALFKSGAREKPKVNLAEATIKRVNSSSNNYEILPGQQIFSKFTDSVDSIAPAKQVKNLINNIKVIKAAVNTPRGQESGNNSPRKVVESARSKTLTARSNQTETKSKK